LERRGYVKLRPETFRLPLQVVHVLIIGHIGTGKTTLAAWLAERIWQDYTRVYVWLRDPEVMEEVIDKLKVLRPQKLLIVWDDATYSLGYNERRSREAMNIFFRIRHIVGAERIVNIFVAHYFRSIPPALRYSHIKALTSIEPQLINGLKELFSLGALWDFAEFYKKHLKPGYALVNVMGTEFILHYEPIPQVWDLIFVPEEEEEDV